MVAASDDQSQSAVQRLRKVLSSLPLTAFSETDASDETYDRWSDWGVIGKLELSNLIMADDMVRLSPCADRSLLIAANVGIPETLSLQRQNAYHVSAPACRLKTPYTPINLFRCCQHMA